MQEPSRQLGGGNNSRDGQCRGLHRRPLTAVLALSLADGLGALYPPFEALRAGLPGLVGNLELENVGHWAQHEASAQVSEQLVQFLRTVNPS